MKLSGVELYISRAPILVRSHNAECIRRENKQSVSPLFSSQEIIHGEASQMLYREEGVNGIRKR